jgi:hypothetical protein
MKKIYLGFLACATIGIIYAFTDIKVETEKGDSNYCITVKCNGVNHKETVNAPGGTNEAKRIIKARYPDCTIVLVSTGACK